MLELGVLTEVRQAIRVNRMGIYLQLPSRTHANKKVEDAVRIRADSHAHAPSV